MSLEDAFKIINNIDNCSEEEILEIYEDIINTLNSNYYYSVANEFIILLIKKINKINIKLELIKEYFMNEFDSSGIFNLFRAISNLNYDEKLIIFKELFSRFKFDEVSDVLDIPTNLKLGIELEYSDVAYNALEKLFENDSINALMKTLKIDDKYCDKIIDKTIFKPISDSSKWVFTVEMDNDRMPEVSTPILKNNISDLNSLKAMFYIFYILGAKVNDWTALQVNVGADYFEGNINAIKYFLSIWGECEELFYKIANKENETIRYYADEMAKPIKENIQRTFNDDDFKLDNKDDFYKFLYNIQVRDELKEILEFPCIDDYYIQCMYSKYINIENEEEKYEIFRNLLDIDKYLIDRIKCTSVNFTHMMTDKGMDGRIEFRMFNNTDDFETILLNITLVGRIMYVCRELANGNIELLERYNNLLNKDVLEEEKLDLLLSLLFDDNTKDIFKKRWQSIKDKAVYENFSTGEATFKTNNQNIQYKKTTNN